MPHSVHQPCTAVQGLEKVASMRTAARERYRGTIAALLLHFCSASSVPPIVLHNQKIFLGSYDILGPFACGTDEVEGSPFDNATALAAAAPHLSHPLPRN